MSAGTQQFILAVLGVGVVVTAFLVPGMDPNARIGLATFGGGLVGSGSVKRPGDSAPAK